MKRITKEQIEAYRTHLTEEERALATIEKYLHEINAFANWLGERAADKRTVLEYKRELTERYASVSVNGALSSLNGFFAFLGWHDLRVKHLRLQKKIFCPQEKELSKAEYERLLLTAKERRNERLYLLMQTICATGIRVSELRYMTTEAVRRGVAEIDCKGKRRQVLLPSQLCRALKRYCCEHHITSGAIFVTKHGNPMDRSNIWSEMKLLCRAANVSEKKVFPHNLRHLFARTYYSLQKDIVRLADLLGHSSIDTTRIYTIEDGEIHRRQIQRLGLLRC